MGKKKEPSNITKQIGLRIKKFRLKKNKTGKDYAGELGISPSKLSDLENGFTTFSADQIFEISEKIDCSPYYLLTGKEITDSDSINKKSPPANASGGKVLKADHDATEAFEGIGWLQQAFGEIGQAFHWMPDTAGREVKAIRAIKTMSTPLLRRLRTEGNARGYTPTRTDDIDKPA